MDIERAKTFGWTVVGGGTLRQSAQSEILETLLNEIERLEQSISTARAEALRDAEEKLERYFDNMFVHGKVDIDDIRAILADKQDK